MEGMYTIENLPLSVANQISYGFTSISENDKAVLSPLIEKLEIQNNNLDYIFTFNTNLYWQNGRKFKASDLNITIPQTTVTVESNNSLKISVPSLYSPLLSVLSKPLFIKDSLIGLGNYRVDSISYQDGHIKLLSLSLQKDKNQKTIYHFYPNASDLYTAFKLGEVDTINTSSLNDQLDGWQKIKKTPSIATNSYLAIFFNTNNLNDKQTRQAIAYATPKSDDKNTRCLGPIPPSSWAYNPQIKPYNFNPTRAKELFTNKTVETLNLVVNDRNLLSKAENIKQSWEEILKVKVNISVNNDQSGNSNYDALLSFINIPSDPDQYSFWHSTQGNTNITHFNNSRIDKLLEEGRLAQDQLERKNIYYDFQKYLLEESPAVFLEFPTTYLISRVK